MIRTNKGFTLIELMVVIVIIGVLAALAIPKFTDASTKAKFAEIPTVMASYDHAQLAHISETGALATSDALVFDAPTNSKWFAYADNTAGRYEGSTGEGAVGPIPSGTLVAYTLIALPTAPATEPSINHEMGESAGDAKKYFNNFLTETPAP